MLDLVSNKKNILVLSGLLVHKPFVNMGRKKPYTQFLLAQKNGEGFRYIKVISFEPSVIKAMEKLTNQCIVEINGHLSFGNKDNVLTTMLVCDTISMVSKFKMLLKSKGGINIEEYIVENTITDTLLSQTIDEDEMTILEKGMSRLK